MFEPVTSMRSFEPGLGGSCCAIATGAKVATIAPAPSARITALAVSSGVPSEP